LPRNIVENSAYRLAIDVASGGLHAVLEDKRSGLRLADGPMVYRTDAAGHENPATLFQLVDPAVSVESHQLIIRGTLVGLRVEHVFALPSDKPVMDETLRLTNPTPGVVSLPDFECGLTRILKDETGRIPADLAGDRWVAVPHRKRAEDPKEKFLDFSASDMADKPGFEAHPDAVQDPPPAGPDGRLGFDPVRNLRRRLARGHVRLPPVPRRARMPLPRLLRSPGPLGAALR